MVQEMSLCVILLGLDGVGKQILLRHHSMSQPQMETRKISFQINDNLCVCVCVCVWERERERERDVQAFEVLHCIFETKTSKQKHAHYHHLLLYGESKFKNLESKQIIENSFIKLIQITDMNHTLQIK
jgi:hypothetical protein